LLADGSARSHLELAYAADVGRGFAVLDLALDHARMPAGQPVEIADSLPDLLDRCVDDTRNPDFRHAILPRCCRESSAPSEHALINASRSLIDSSENSWVAACR